MGKQLLRKIDDHTLLYRDPKSGIAWVEDQRAGVAHSCHPNTRASLFGRKRTQGQRTVRANGFDYAIDDCFVSTDLDELARQHCACGGNHTKGG